MDYNNFKLLSFIRDNDAGNKDDPMLISLDFLKDKCYHRQTNYEKADALIKKFCNLSVTINKDKFIPIQLAHNILLQPGITLSFTGESFKTLLEKCYKIVKISNAIETNLMILDQCPNFMKSIDSVMNAICYIDYSEEIKKQTKIFSNVIDKQQKIITAINIYNRELLGLNKMLVSKSGDKHLSSELQRLSEKGIEEDLIADDDLMIDDNKSTHAFEENDNKGTIFMIEFIKDDVLMYEIGATKLPLADRLSEINYNSFVYSKESHDPKGILSKILSDRRSKFATYGDCDRFMGNKTTMISIIDKHVV